MTRRSLRDAGRFLASTLSSTTFLLAMLLMAAARSGGAQAGPYERNYRQPKSAVERALQELQPSMSGRLPVLEGFASPGDHPLNRYQRAFYQTAVQVNSTASGGSVVRVTTKVTAWYTDSIPSHSGYQLLTSNGLLESDLLDQLTDLLAIGPSAARSRGGSSEDFPAIAPSAAAKRPATAEIRSCGKRDYGAGHLGTDASVAGNRAHVLIFVVAGVVESATVGVENIAGAFSST